MRPYLVFINGVEVAGIYAADYAGAKLAAKRLYRVACDVIG
jgi:hypothetical protein